MVFAGTMMHHLLFFTDDYPHIWSSIIETIQKILLVDDEPDFLSALQRFLKREAFELLTANEGEEAQRLILNAAQGHAPFDLVITDLIMPKVDGWRLIEWIQEHHPQIATIILTGVEKNEKGRLKLRPNRDLQSKKTLTPQQLLNLIHRLDKVC